MLKKVKIIKNNDNKKKICSQCFKERQEFSIEVPQAGE